MWTHTNMNKMNYTWEQRRKQILMQYYFVDLFIVMLYSF